MTQKTLPFTGVQKDKFILALVVNDVTSAINTALRIRKATFTLDYSEDHFARLYVSMPGINKEMVLRLDQRKHICYVTFPKNRSLFAVMQDISERLAKLGASLNLTGDRPKQGPARAVLQVYVQGADKIAISLMDVFKGKKKSDTAFQLPDGTTP